MDRAFDYAITGLCVVTDPSKAPPNFTVVSHNVLIIFSMLIDMKYIYVPMKILKSYDNFIRTHYLL